MISFIIATDKKGAIGKENRIPWRIRSDLILLKQLTLGNTVILGRKTYDSMVFYYDRSGRPMPGKRYVIITHDKTYVPKREGTVVVHSVEEALKVAKQSHNEIFVIGGSQIYELLLPYADRIYLTEVATEADGDTFFPPLDKAQWHETSRTHHEKNDKDEFDFDTVILERS
jgi:dihydrofolate reductase